MKKSYAVTIIAIILAIPFAAAAGWLANDITEPDAIRIIPEVKVYKNGELVYHKIGDPPTDNLAIIWLADIRPDIDVNGNVPAFNITDLLGNAEVVPTSYNPTLYVIVGTGTAAPSYQDSTMQGVAAAPAQLVSLAWDATNTAWVMQITAAVTLGSAATISEVGLAVERGYNGTVPETNLDPLGTHATNFYLVFRDVLAQSISAAAGDVIEVQYTITIDFP